MYNLDEYKELTSKYGSVASWAIWNDENLSDTSIIDLNFNELNSKYILLGLNISKPLKDKSWINFHSGKHDRKLKQACNHSILRGSYMTDIFKCIDNPNSADFRRSLTDRVIRENVDSFIQEMQDVKVNEKSQFIVFGKENSLIAQCFDKYFKTNFKNNVIYYYHYSYYTLTDKDWVRGLWQKLNIELPLKRQ